MLQTTGAETPFFNLVGVAHAAGSKWCVLQAHLKALDFCAATSFDLSTCSQPKASSTAAILQRVLEHRVCANGPHCVHVLRPQAILRILTAV